MKQKNWGISPSLRYVRTLRTELRVECHSQLKRSFGSQWNWRFASRANMITGMTFISAGAFNVELIPNNVVYFLNPPPLSRTDVPRGSWRYDSVAAERIGHEIDLCVAIAFWKLWVLYNFENEIGRPYQVQSAGTNFGPGKALYGLLLCFRLRKSRPNMVPKLVESSAIVVRPSSHPGGLNLQRTASLWLFRKRVKRYPAFF